jgi:hypothetical protein
MRLPSSIAFGVDDTFATCGESRTANWDNEPADFTGPVLWSADPAVFAIQPPDKNGSHLDMLHSTPFCMGIAHETAHVYWAVNGDVGALDRYDFHEPHEVGGHDHSDGEVSRWALGELRRVPGVPSHADYDARSGWIYVADTGHGRVLRVDTRTGKAMGSLPTDDAELRGVARIEGATLEAVVAEGVLERPSGLALSGDTLLVTDNATSRIHAFDTTGAQLVSLDTELPTGTLAGVAVGPEGKIYLTDLVDGAIFRIDPLR